MIDVINWSVIFRAIRFYYPFLYNEYKLIPDTLNNFYKIVAILAESIFNLGYTLFIGLFIFVQIGTWCYGGLINSSLVPGIAGGSINTKYTLNNFNDFWGGFITLYEIIIINNW